jgi:hypothetical protein
MRFDGRNTSTLAAMHKIKKVPIDSSQKPIHAFVVALL